MGYKVFQNGTALTAEVMNDLIMEQAVPTFADASARDNAIPAPNDGQHCYLISTKETYKYVAGRGWVALLGENVGGLTARSTLVCTSTTRPTQAAGRFIWETDTQRAYVSNGTSWLYVPSQASVAATPVTMAGGWYQWGGGYAALSYSMTGSIVTLQGVVGNSNAFNNPGIVCNVPAPARPLNGGIMFGALAGTTSGLVIMRMDLNGAGDLTALPNGLMVNQGAYWAISATYNIYG